MEYKLTINDIPWRIIDKPFDEVNELYMQNPGQYEGTVNGFTDDFNSIIYIASELSNVKTKKLLFHELTHAFVGEYVTCDVEKAYAEEDMAEFNGFYGMKIAGIVLDYISSLDGITSNYSTDFVA